MKYLGLVVFLMSFLGVLAFGAYQSTMDSTRTTARIAGFNEAKAQYAPKAPVETAGFASGLCAGVWPDGVLALFDADMGIAQDDLDTYTANYKTQGKKCVEVAFLGSVPHANGRREDIYRITYNDKALWYIFTVGPDGHIIAIQ